MASKQPFKHQDVIEHNYGGRGNGTGDRWMSEPLLAGILLLALVVLQEKSGDCTRRLLNRDWAGCNCSGKIIFLALAKAAPFIMTVPHVDYRRVENRVRNFFRLQKPGGHYQYRLSDRHPFRVGGKCLELFNEVYDLHDAEKMWDRSEVTALGRRFIASCK